MIGYAHPGVLVDTSWVKGNIGNQNVRILEVDYDPTANYNLWHIPTAGLIDWKKDINDPVTRAILTKEGREEHHPLTKDVPEFEPATFRGRGPDERLRVCVPYVREVLRQSDKVLVDVR